MSFLSPLINKAQLAAELNCSEQTLKKYEKIYPDFPQSIKLGARVYWRRDDIEIWLKNFLPSKRVNSPEAP